MNLIPLKFSNLYETDIGLFSGRHKLIHVSLNVAFLAADTCERTNTCPVIFFFAKE